MSKRTKIMALVGMMLIGAFVVFMGAGAFSASQAVNVTAGIPPTLALAVTTPVDFGSGLAPGSTYPSSATATVSSNKIWSMTVAKGADMTSGTDTIPSANLTYGVTSADPNILNKQAAGTQFATGGTNVCSACTRGSGEILTINYSLTVPWTVNGSATPYTATHTYTATQP